MAVAEIEHAVVLGILTKLKIKVSDDIPEKRARKKLQRVLAKEDVRDVKFNKKELAAIEAIGAKAPASEEGGDEAEEKTKKTSTEGTIKAPKGNVEFIKTLHAKGLSREKVLKKFAERYASTGRDEKFVEKRFRLYYALATGEAKGGRTVKSKKDKKAKGSKKSAKSGDEGKKLKKAKVEEKPAKKGKKLKKKSSDEEE